MHRLLAVLPLVATACAEPGVAPPYHAQVATLVSIDPDSESGRYEIRARELTTVTDLAELDGPHLRMRRGGTIGNAQVDGGDAPALRYDVVDGVIVARDFSTLVMLSAFHQFERVFAELPRLTGETIDDLSRGRTKLEVFFEPTVTNRLVGPPATTNAAYIMGRRQFMLLKRSNVEQVPLAVDFHVIAHEFGHLVFEHTVFGDAAVECGTGETSSTLFPGRLTSEYAMRGFNEGFADFFAFAAFGGTNALAAVIGPLPERSLARSRFVYDDLATACRGEFYCIGTLFARSLYETLPDPADAVARGARSREVVAALRGVVGRLVADPSLLPAPSFAAQICQLAHDPAYDGRVAGAFLDAFIGGLPAPTRPAVCARLIANFGDVGFPREARRACPGL